MAIYHLGAKIVSRGTGRSAVAASAYMSCSAILNEYDGIQHDYTRKGGLVCEQVFLPDCAPKEWLDRSVLWNAVEEAEKTKDSPPCKGICSGSARRAVGRSMEGAAVRFHSKFFCRRGDVRGRGDP